jgi:hypothetical protein
MNKFKSIKVFTKLLIDEISKFDSKKKCGRRRKHDIKFYIDKNFEVLIKGTSWINCFPISCKNRYKNSECVKKCFYKWRNESIFLNIYKKLCQKYRKRMSVTILTNLNIDSTTIANLNGTFYGHSYKIKNKKSLNLTITADHNNVIHNILFDKSNKHDSKAMMTLFKNKKYTRKINLLADKGYIVGKNDKKILKNKGINLLVPNKKNSKVKTTIPIHLKNKRIKVEHLFSTIKRGYRRLNNIFDRKLDNLYTWVRMVNSILVISQLK